MLGSILSHRQNGFRKKSVRGYFSKDLARSVHSELASSGRATYVERCQTPGGSPPGVSCSVHFSDMVIAAIQQAIALKNTYNIRVINLSLGRGIATNYAQDPLCQAVESAWNAGIVVVVAAGNFGRISVNGSNGYGTVAAPGNDPLVLTVGAMKAMGSYSRSDDQIASYSSKGPTTYDHVVKPDVVAPGNSVVSTNSKGSTLEGEFPANDVAGNGSGQDYFILSGTSMGTAVEYAATQTLSSQVSATRFFRLQLS